MRLVRNNRRPLNKGFTLIELLVVVAIIALLISILLPSLSRARAQARQIICLTHLRAMGESARLYAADNTDFIPRGIQGFGGTADREYAIFVTCVMKYLGYDGNDSLKLWRSGSQVKKKRVNEICQTIPQFQCADFPPLEDEPLNQPGGDSPFDYVVSAMPIPYDEDNINADQAGDLEWDEGGGYQGENVDGYMQATKIEDLPRDTNASDMIYLTESHTSLPWGHQRYGLRFHTCFLASQLPFGGRPRIANDQRHPGGIDALFFDGHARSMELHEVDVAYPNTLDKRLRWFTVMPEWWQP